MVNLSPTQQDAVVRIKEWLRAPRGKRIFNLQGYAGTGKSTLVKEALRQMYDEGICRRHMVATYTGKAAKVLRDMGNPTAQTIHSLIYRLVDEDSGSPKFVLNEESDLHGASLCILDECSMVSQEVLDDILKFGVPILMLGDPGQLPPIEGNSPLQYLDKDVFLSEIHRQAEDSPILRLATMARRGEEIPFGDYGQGVRVLPLGKLESPWALRDDTKILVGTHFSRHRLTKYIREEKLGADTARPVIGEPVMCCRNNRELGIINGEEYTLTDIEVRQISKRYVFGIADPNGRELTRLNVVPVKFQQHYAGKNWKDTCPDPKMLQRDEVLFDFAHVVTCHKAQGSQWDDVTVVDESRVFRDDQHRWLYTAITRAAKSLTIYRRD